MREAGQGVGGTKQGYGLIPHGALWHELQQSLLCLKMQGAGLLCLGLSVINPSWSWDGNAG